MNEILVFCSLCSLAGEANDRIHALILRDLEHGDSTADDDSDDEGSNFPLFIKDSSSPDDTFRF